MVRLLSNLGISQRCVEFSKCFVAIAGTLLQAHPVEHRDAASVGCDEVAYQLERGQLLRELQHGQGVYRMCLQAGIQMVRKMSMEMACANFHSLEQRVAKWLLIRHDLHRSAPILTTHQSAADSLGVRREAITLTLPKMRGLSFSRGAIEVEDREMLEHTTCECYVAQRQVRPFQLPLPMFDVP